VEVELEPSFNALELGARIRLLLDDHDSRYRRNTVPDDQPELQRYVHTGRFRPTGDWCAVTHLVPAVVRVRSDRRDMTRERTYALMESVLERLDAGAFVAWRDAVHEQNGTRHDPNLPPWRSGRPAGDTTAGEAPPHDPLPGGDPGGGRNTGDEQPAIPAAYRLPSPDELKASLDRAPLGAPLVLDHEAIAAALGGGVEKLRTLVVDGLGEGSRIQSPGGRAVDIVRVDDESARRAFALGKLDGVRMDPPQEIAGYRYANLDDDTDHAIRRVLTTAGGTTYYVRVRGMKREDTIDVVRAVTRQLTD
jgi:hypothetical protein